MYLSKLLLNRHSRAVQTDLAHPYELHRTLARAFETPEGTAYREHHGVLFRAEEGAAPALLVQSHTKPDWGALPAGYLDRAHGPKPFELRFGEGQTLRFRLVANPTKTVVRDGKKRHLGLFRDQPGEDGLPTYWDWLTQQGTRYGFEVVEARDQPFRAPGSRCRNGHAFRSKTRIPFVGVQFDGWLRVTDAERVAEAVRSGIGRSKAFGFGLLSLAR